MCTLYPPKRGRYCSTEQYPPTDIFDQHKSHIVSQIFRSGIWDPKSKSGSKWEMCEVYEKPEERLQPKILIWGLRDHPSSMIHQSFIKSSCITSIFQMLLIKNDFSRRTIPSHIICSYMATNIMYYVLIPAYSVLQCPEFHFVNVNWQRSGQSAQCLIIRQLLSDRQCFHLLSRRQ